MGFSFSRSLAFFRSLDSFLLKGEGVPVRGHALLLVKAEYEDSYGNSASPKTPEEAFFASEETEAVPVESEVFCRNGGVKRIFTSSQFASTAKIKSNKIYEKSLK
ncbi:hypothetical protein [Virgibacillus sp. DJP39]|uniref:hypothetical protein n=1 Tax=Virgibacillus sp. DJP39 TaxID=3409790 RepID=UPI003BB65687